jgi:1,2-diacylglycerol 3-alpha-glucosyltransferase
VNATTVTSAEVQRRTLRISLVTETYPPEINGVASVMGRLVQGLEQRGHLIHLICPRQGKQRSQDREGGRQETRVPGLPMPKYHGLRFGMPVYWRLRRIWRTALPDGVYIATQGPLGHAALSAARRIGIATLTGFHTRFHQYSSHYGLGWLEPHIVATLRSFHNRSDATLVPTAQRIGIPVVASYHTFFEQYLEKYVTFLPSSWLRLAARRLCVTQCGDVDALVVPSRAMLSILEGYGVTTPARVIPTGIELEQFRHGDGRRFRYRHGIAVDRPVLVHVGRLAYEKNIAFLLRMLVEVKREIPDVLLVIAGEGPARQSLESTVVELGLLQNLLFVGYLSRDGALEDCYCAGNAFVFASRTETQGLVLLEAMALGVPVVSTAAMGTKEVLEGGAGCLIADDDEADFAAKAMCMLSHPDLRATLSEQARAHARFWSAPELAARMLDLYETVRARGQ